MKTKFALLMLLVVINPLVKAGAQVDTVVSDQPQYSFSVHVPTQWKRSEAATPEGYKFVFYNDIEVFAVMIEAPTEFDVRIQKDIEDGLFTDSYKKALKQEWENRTIKQNVVFDVGIVANNKWLSELSLVSRTTMDNTVVNSMLLFSRVHRGKKYIIQFIGGPALTKSDAIKRFSQANEQYFDAILKTFWIY